MTGAGPANERSLQGPNIYFLEKIKQKIYLYCSLFNQNFGKICRKNEFFKIFGF